MYVLFLPYLVFLRDKQLDNDSQYFDPPILKPALTNEPSK